MKKFCYCSLLLFVALISCSPRSHRSEFSALDRAIEKQPYFDRIHERKQDSLRRVYRAAQTDSARWAAAYELEKIFYYHHVDSCYAYITAMDKYCDADPVRKNITRACYAITLQKMDSLKAALKYLERIDTSALTPAGIASYCFAGYHIYGDLAAQHPDYIQKRNRAIDMWWRTDSTQVECAFYHNRTLQDENDFGKAIGRLLACEPKTPNDTAKFHYCLAREYLLHGDKHEAIRHFARSAQYDMRVSAKTYSALYELARLLFREGNIERADRYMRISLIDANASHFKTRYNNIVQMELEIMDTLLKQQERQKRAYLTTSAIIALLLAAAMILLILLGRYSSRLNKSRKDIHEVSSIKDGFLAGYMEKCVIYLNKVDEYRSSLRKTLKNDGTDAVKAMLRKPSFASGEFNDLLTSFDTTFLGIFPDFVDRVNEHMQDEYELTMPAKGTLSTELRILALIKLGISKRNRIAKILNMSVTTVYSYHCNLQKHSLHPDASFDKVIAGL